MRSFEPLETRKRYMQAIRDAFQQAAEQLGGNAEVTYDPHCTSYEISKDESLLAIYRKVLAERGVEMQMQPTFIGSDTSAFRPRVKAFTISTGVVNEHSAEEYIALAPLEQIVEDTLNLLELARNR
jgi:tripeptide aminopeptidase